MSKENCSDYLRSQGKAFPRTCRECGLGPCKHKEKVVTKRPLKELSFEDYQTLKKMGFLWEFYPEATGNYEQDTEKKIDKTDELKILLKEACLIMNKIKYWPDHDILVDKFNEKVKSAFSKSEIDN